MLCTLTLFPWHFAPVEFSSFIAGHEMEEKGWPVNLTAFRKRVANRVGTLSCKLCLFLNWYFTGSIYNVCWQNWTVSHWHCVSQRNQFLQPQKVQVTVWLPINARNIASITAIFTTGWGVPRWPGQIFRFSQLPSLMALR